jgi:4-amino-4-deoxy-L-arabinose transferase-like glycosyltransferase
LARRLCDHPIHAALAALFTPVFMVSSTTLMCDVLMVALWVWAVVLWMRGLQNNQPLLLVLGAILVGACSLAKYFGNRLDSFIAGLLPDAKRPARLVARLSPDTSGHHRAI